MTHAQIAASTDVKALREYKAHEEFMVWNHEMEGSQKGANTSLNKVHAVNLRIMQLENKS